MDNRDGREISQINNQESPQCWQIPRDSIPLDKLLQLQGYEVRDVESFSTHYKSVREVRGHSDLLLKFPVFKGDNGEDTLGDPILVYGMQDIGYQHPHQIDEALILRDFLDENKVKYEEDPSREKIAQSLRETSRKAVSLADRLEGKQ